MSPVSTTLVALWVPDWPVVAAATLADVPAHQPVAVHAGQRLTAVSTAARAVGVRRGMRQRQAQEACPDLVLLPDDALRDARLFEPVAAAADEVVAGVEIARPGLLLAPAGGASRFYGSSTALAARLVDAVAHETGHESHVGIAEGVLAAVLAAREDRVLPDAAARTYLDPRPLTDLVYVAMSPERITEIRDLVDLWDRLGIRAMTDLAGLAEKDVLARFGEAGTWAHQLVRGLDLRPPAQERLEADLDVSCELDPPAERIDTAAFAARRLAEQLYAALVERSASCGRLEITARTTEGVDLARTWRTDAGTLGGLTAARITDRVRWQLEGWLSGGGQGPLTRIGLAAQDLAPAGVHQGGLWGADAGGQVRARRALERVQGLLGVESVLGVQLQGGREVRDQVHLVPWGSVDVAQRTRDLPWPGRLPEPAPARVLTEPRPVRLLTGDSAPVRVDRRLALSGDPAVLEHDDAQQHLDGWAGPWPVAQRWWRSDASRAVYLQVLAPSGALLVSCRRDEWFLEAHYD